jgi:hypothetical protein
MCITGPCGSNKTGTVVEYITGRQTLPSAFTSNKFIVAVAGIQQGEELQRRLVREGCTTPTTRIDSSTHTGKVKSSVIDYIRDDSKTNGPSILIVCYQSVISMENQSAFNPYTVIADDMNAWCQTYDVAFDMDLRLADHFVEDDTNRCTLSEHAIANYKGFEGVAKMENYNLIYDLLTTKKWKVTRTATNAKSSMYYVEPTLGAFPKNLILVGASITKNVELQAFINEYKESIDLIEPITLVSPNDNPNTDKLKLVWLSKDSNTRYRRQKYPEVYNQLLKDGLKHVPEDAKCLVLSNRGFDVEALGRPLVKLPYNNEGSNEYMDANYILLQVSLNYDPATVAHYGKKGFTQRQLHTNRTIEKYYQSAMRTALRSEQEFQGGAIIVHSYDDAVELRDTFFQNAELVRGSMVEYPKENLRNTLVDETPLTKSELKKGVAIRKMAKAGKYNGMDNVRVLTSSDTRSLMKLKLWNEVSTNGKPLKEKK